MEQPNQIQENYLNGQLLLVDKPIDWTSFDVVNYIRSLLKRFHKLHRLKVGHAGTLDPLASGLLLVCTGKMTKQIQAFQDRDKTYTGQMQLGMTTPSYDLETEIDATFSLDDMTTEDLEQTRKLFIGNIEQLPPAYSAVKIGGKRAFEYARKQKSVHLEYRKVHISRFELTSITLPYIEFVVQCTKGTYIRSLVHDFGQALNNGACLTNLRRTHIGEFDVNHALTPDQIRENIMLEADL